MTEKIIEKGKRGKKKQKQKVHKYGKNTTCIATKNDYFIQFLT